MSEPVAAKRNRRRWLIVAVLIVAILLVALGYWLFTEGPGARLLSPPRSSVTEFAGEGDQITSSFRVRQGWQIRWESSGARFALTIRGDRNFGTVVNEDEPASGVTSPPAPGTFHLEVSAEGPWTITVLQGN